MSNALPTDTEIMDVVIGTIEANPAAGFGDVIAIWRDLRKGRIDRAEVERVRSVYERVVVSGGAGYWECHVGKRRRCRGLRVRRNAA